jgi:hypothetical protein
VVSGDTINYLNQLSQSENKTNGNALRFTIQINADKSNLISSNTNYRDGLNQTSQNFSNTYSDNTNSQKNGFNNLSTTKSLHKFFNEGLSYIKLFTEKGHSLNGAFLFTNNNMNLENNNTQNQLSSLPSSNGYSIKSNNTSVNSNNNFNWGVNYTRPVNKYFKLFLGYRGISTKLNMNDNYYFLDPSLQSYYEDMKRKVIQGYNDLSQEISFGLNGTLYDVQYDLSLRTANKHTTTENKVLNNSYSNNFTNYDPKISITTNITEGQTIGINLMRWTDYPLNKQLNPYLDYSDSTNIIAGNPELKPYSSNTLFLLYNISKEDLWGSVRISYFNIQNMIDMVTTVVSPNVLKTSYQNIAGFKGYNIGVYFQQKLAGWLEIEPDFGGGWSKYNSLGISSESKSWTGRISSKASFNNFKFQMDFNYSSPSSDAQQKTYATFYANAAAKLLLLDKNLSLTLRVSDIFNSKNRNSGKFGTDFTIMNNIRQTTRIFSLELAYYFQSKANDILEQEKNDTELPDDF